MIDGANAQSCCDAQITGGRWGCIHGDLCGDVHARSNAHFLVRKLPDYEPAASGKEAKDGLGSQGARHQRLLGGQGGAATCGAPRAGQRRLTWQTKHAATGRRS